MPKFKRNIDIVDIIRHRNKMSEERKKGVSLLSKNIRKIKRHSLTKEIHYPSFKESFDYVDNIFPNVNIKDIVVYKVNRAFLEKIGYQGVGGFYDKIYKTVVFSSSILPGNRGDIDRWSVRGKISKDETLTHELLHYCYFEENISTSVDMQEEFAYGWSYGYLKTKGYTDDKIIADNYLPHLFNVARKVVLGNILARDGIKTEWNNASTRKRERIYRKYNKEIYNSSLEIARERGKQIIKIYCEKCGSERVGKNIENKKINRYDLMDI